MAGLLAREASGRLAMTSPSIPYMAAMPSDGPRQLKRLAFARIIAARKEADMLIGGFFDAHHRRGMP